MDVLAVFCVTHSLDATKRSLEPALDPIEGTGKESVQDQTRGIEITNVNKSPLRMDSNELTVSPLNFKSPKPSRSSRAETASMFSFVVGDFYRGASDEHSIDT